MKKLEEIMELIPENERFAVVSEIRKAKSVDDVKSIAEKYNIDINAQAVFDKFSSAEKEELDDEKLESVAAGVNWDALHCMCGD